MKKIMMNKSKIFVVVMLVASTFAACKKFISPEPVSSFSEDQIFSNLPYAKSAVIGIYNALANQQYWGLNVSLLFPMDVDDFKGQGGTNDNATRDMGRYAMTSLNQAIPGPYQYMYIGIERANICIEQIPKMDLYNSGSAQTKGELRRLYGESLTLRAQCYFDLVKIWGDVPEQRIPSAELSSPYLPKTDRDSIYNHVLNDLKIAEDLVPWRTEIGQLGDSPDERITKGAVKALRARIALFRGGYSLRPSNTMLRNSDYLTYYQIAKDECNDIMARRDQHTLNPSYKSVWKDYVCGRNGNEPNGELIFQVAEGGNGVGSADGRIGIFDGTKVGTIGGQACLALPTYFYSFDSTDVRRDVTIAPYETKADLTTRLGHNINLMVDGKFRREWWSNPVNPTLNTLTSGLNWPLIRFSDVLLMYAEADNELNHAPSSTAIAAVSEVSKRAHGGNQALVPAIPTDYTGFFKFIVRERFLEFGFEAIRKYDLIRWNLLATVVTETRANLVNMGLATPVPMNPPSYMTAPPAYCLSTTLPKTMYYSLTTTADDSKIWVNSLYKVAPTATPAGTAKVSWVGYSGISGTFTEWAGSFKPNHSEIFPIASGIVAASRGAFTNDYGY